MKITKLVRHPQFISIATLSVGIFIATLGFVYQENENVKKNQILFEHAVKDFSEQFTTKVGTYEHGLLGTRGVFYASGIQGATRKAFSAYSHSRNTEKEFPGAAGVGFIRRVPRVQEAEFVQQARLDGMPDFAIRQMAPHDGDRYVIQYMESNDGNTSAIGLDIASEPNRKLAAEHAMRAGKASLTSPITIVRSGSAPLPAFLLLLPVYQANLPLDTPELRQAAHIGWCYFPLVIEELFKNIHLRENELGIKLTDVTDEKVPSKFYASADFDQIKSEFTSSVQVTIFEREWQIEFKARPYLLIADAVKPFQVSAGICVLFVLLSILVYFVLRNRERHRQATTAQGRFAAIVESSGDAIVSTDLGGVVTSWNRAAEVIFGYTEPEAIGRKINDLIVPEELTQEDEQFFKRIARGELVPHFLTVRHTRNGRRIDVSVSVSPIRGPQGEILGAAKTLRDNTGQKRSEEMFRLAVEAAPNAMLLVDQSQSITLVNRKAEELFGYDRTELVGSAITRLVPLRYRAKHPQLVKDYKAAPKTRSMGNGQALYGVCKDGCEVLIEIGLNPIETADGNFTLASVVDISKRHALESKLQLTLARLEMALDSSGLGIWIWNLGTNELIWDKRMLALYGAPETLQETKLYFEFWRSRVHPEDLKYTEQKLTGHVAGTDIFYDVIFRIILANGEIRFIQAAGILEHDEMGRPTQMVGTNRDVTDVQTAQARVMQANASLEKQVTERTAELQDLNSTLEQQVATRSAELNKALELARHANNAKSDFLANMSHEIRTPMNAILGLAYLVEKQPLTPVVHDMVNKIHNAGRSLLGIINDILDFSKIEANHIEIESVPFRLSDVLDNLANIMSSSVGEKDINILVAPAPEGADYLHGDALRLGQVLVNLASNAIKFTHTGAVMVRIECLDCGMETDKRRIRFAVCDTGVGIAPEKQENIFNAFSQADSSTTRNFGGTGLGLTISRHLVSLMGGQLQLKSQVGVGSEFYFELTFEISIPVQSTMPAMLHQRILIADDNESARLLLSANASSLGWNVKTADSGLKAIEMVLAADAEHKPFDVLLLDWRMPGMDGIVTATAMREQLGHKNGPIVIMVTSHDRDIFMEQPGSEIADNFIAKPVTSSSLFNAVMHVKSERNEFKLDPNRRGKLHHRLAQFTILVVDDSEINREVAYQILTGEGAVVELAADGQKALDILKTKPEFFDVVLMDVQMPVMDGYTATRHIRATTSLKHLPVIALTAGAFKTHQNAALEAGMNDFIAKPFNVDDLIEMVLNVVRGIKRASPQPLLVSARPVKPAIDFEVLAFIDLERGLETWRVPKAYQQNLRIFSRDHAQDAQHLAREVAAGKLSHASEIIHRFRGAAGALALTRVAHIAETIEETLSTGTIENGMLNLLAPALSQTISAIQDYLGDDAVALQVAPPVVDSNFNLQAALQQLLASLQSDDPDVIEPMLAPLAGTLAQDQFDAINSAIEMFDFRYAEKLTQNSLDLLLKSPA